MSSDPNTFSSIDKIGPILTRLNFAKSLRDLEDAWTIHEIDVAYGSGILNAVYVYVYARPEYVIAQAIADGDTPEDALRKWEASISKMLKDFRLDRRQTLLVEMVSALLYDDRKGREQASPQSPNDDKDAVARVGHFSPLELGLATLTVYQANSAKQLLSELVAHTASLPGCNEPPKLDLNRIQASLRVSKDSHEYLNKKTRLLILYNNLLKEELEWRFSRQKELNGPIDLTLHNGVGAPDSLGDDEHTLHFLQRRLTRIESSNSWRLTAPFRRVTHILHRRPRVPKPPLPTSPLKKRLKYYRQRVRRMETSRSWRMTKPLRLLNGMLQKRSGLFMWRKQRVLTAIEAQLESQSKEIRRLYGFIGKTVETEVLNATKIINKAMETQIANATKSMGVVVNKQATSSVKQIEAFFELKSYFESGLQIGKLHGWPISPDLALHIIQKLEERPYDLVIEFGSGTSTRLIAEALGKISMRQRERPRPVQVSFEHIEKYYQKSRSLLLEHGLADCVDLRLAALKPFTGPDAEEYCFYDCEAVLQTLAASFKSVAPKILVFVDGPPGRTGRNARYPALPIILDKFKSCSIDLVLDDFYRPSEKEVVRKWIKELEDKNVEIDFSEEDFEKGACSLSFEIIESIG